MALGYGLHVGLARVDPNFHGEPFLAPGCDVTAHAMRDLAEKIGYQHTTLIVNESAKLAAFLDAVSSTTHQLKADDIMLVTMAGHGLNFVATGEPDEPRDQALRLFDGKLVDDTVYTLLAAIKVPARVIVVAEACFSATIVEAARGPGGQVDAGVSLERSLDEAHARAVTFPGPGRPKVTANVLLLAAAGETSVAQGLNPAVAGVPPFTRALLAEFVHATSYRDLLTRMVARTASTSFSTPVLNDRLVTEPGFPDQKPFSI